VHLLKNDLLSGRTTDMRVETDAEIAALLASVKTVAVVGVSANVSRPSYRVFEFWCERDVKVIPVNPRLAGQVLCDRTVVPALSDINESIDLVDIFRAGHHLPPVIDEALAAGVGAIWTQLGVRHPQAEETVLVSGTRLVVDRCPAIEVPRLTRLGYETDHERSEA
jgi:predicted CoA-binding protein